MILTGPLGRTFGTDRAISSINKVSLVSVSSCSNTGSIRDNTGPLGRTFGTDRVISSINKVSLVSVSSCSNTGSIRDNPYWTSRENILELIELSSIN